MSRPVAILLIAATLVRAGDGPPPVIAAALDKTGCSQLLVRDETPEGLGLSLRDVAGHREFWVAPPLGLAGPWAGLQVSPADGDPLYIVSWYRPSFGYPGVTGLTVFHLEGDAVELDATLVLEACFPMGLCEQAQGAGWVVRGFDSVYRTIEVVMRERQPVIRMSYVPSDLDEAFEWSAAHAQLRSVPTFGPRGRQDAWVGLAIEADAQLRVWWRMAGEPASWSRPMMCAFPWRMDLTPVALWLGDNDQVRVQAVLSERGLIWFEREGTDLQLADLMLTDIGPSRQIVSRVHGSTVTVACLDKDGTVTVFDIVAPLQEPTPEVFETGEETATLLLGDGRSLAVADHEGVVRRLR